MEGVDRRRRGGVSCDVECIFSLRLSCGWISFIPSTSRDKVTSALRRRPELWIFSGSRGEHVSAKTLQRLSIATVFCSSDTSVKDVVKARPPEYTQHNKGFEIGGTH